MLLLIYVDFIILTDLTLIIDNNGLDFYSNHYNYFSKTSEMKSKSRKKELYKFY